MAKKVVKEAKSAKKPAAVKRAAAKIVRKPAKRATVARRMGPQPVATAAPSWVEDHIAILQLLHKYCHAVDRGTAEEVAQLFHVDGVLLPRFESDERYEGRAAVQEWYARYMENFRATVRYLRHKIESPVIELNGHEATSVCYLDADSITLSSNIANVAFGRYDDKLIKDGGRWFFKERTIIVYYRYPLAMYYEGRGV